VVKYHALDRRKSAQEKKRGGSDRQGGTGPDRPLSWRSWGCYSRSWRRNLIPEKATVKEAIVLGYLRFTDNK
jgi:hypothetical protein